MIVFLVVHQTFYLLRYLREIGSLYVIFFHKQHHFVCVCLLLFFNAALLFFIRVRIWWFSILLIFFMLTFYSGLLPFLSSATSDNVSLKFCVTLRWITWKKKRVLKVLRKVYFGPKWIFYSKHIHNSKDEAVLSQNTLETMTVVESFEVVQKKGSFLEGGGSGYHVKV